MNEQQASHIIANSRNANHQISQIQFSYSQKAKQNKHRQSVSQNENAHISRNNQISSKKDSDFSSIMMNMQQIRKDPSCFVNRQTTRDTLFRIIYLLQQKNKELIHTFQVNKNYLLNQPNIQNKYNLSKAQQQQPKIIIGHLKQKNAQNNAQIRLLELYRKQKQQLAEKLQAKYRSVEDLAAHKKDKQHKRDKLNVMVKNTNHKLIQYKKQIQKLIDQAKKKKTNEKLGDSGIVDRLLNQYYETIKEVLDQDSVDRINTNTKAALSQVQKRKNIGFYNLLRQNMQVLEKDNQ